MTTSIFQGEQVRLVMDDLDDFAKAFSRWGRDSEFIRLLDDLARLVSVRTARQWFDNEPEKAVQEEIFFIIHTLESNRSIGFVDLGSIAWNHGEAWVGIGLGEREDWGKGYGTDAMHVILRYAFTELNLHRVSLGVFEYNPRAVHSYEKVGFIYEGRIRKQLKREGKHWDVIQMGVLRDEWLRQVKGDQQ
jgi:RimJ/RimL family protein N-acetyltransferase